MTEEELHIYKSRYCVTCLVERPPLASHCRKCNHCVKVFDHHCEMVNNCIGIRNRKDFLLLAIFLTWSTSLYFLVFKIYMDSTIA